MLKTKISFTVFVVYEIVAVILLHSAHICNAMFSPAFCYDSGFKYFIFCAAIPLLAMVIGMWIYEIFRKRHRSLLGRAGAVVSDVASDIKDQIGHSIDFRDIDKYLAAAILFGIKKYSASHPQVRHAVRDIIDSANGRRTDTTDDYDDDEDDDYDTSDSDNRSGSRNNRASSRTSSRTTRTRQTSSGTQYNSTSRTSSKKR